MTPPAASSIAGQVDLIAGVWLAFSVVVLTVVFGMMIVFCARFYRRGTAVQKLPERTRNHLEWSWTILLTVIGVAIGFWADDVYFRMHVPPPDATPVYVVAKQWMWKVQHEDGSREINELHVPLGEPIKLIMSSSDVIHSFYVPAFRIKQDVVPGRYTYLWFRATKTGEFPLYCAEFCGTSHSVMGGKVVVLSPSDYQQWRTTTVSGRAGQVGGDLAARGRGLFTSLGCISCHDSQGRLAPQLQGLYMSRVGLDTGASVIADENYLRESIVDPGAKIVQGYSNIMPTFQGQISEEGLLGLIAYVKSLQHYERAGK